MCTTSPKFAGLPEFKNSGGATDKISMARATAPVAPACSANNTFRYLEVRVICKPLVDDRHLNLYVDILQERL